MTILYNVFIMSKQIYDDNGCSVAYAMSIIGGKWKIAIVWKLMEKRLRYSELRSELDGVSEGVLISQLKELANDGVIKRISYNVVPPHVEYELTAEGRKLKPALLAIEQWGANKRTSATSLVRT
jgi:DNA-binding HxlR family transcriptional regulator